MDFLTSNEKVKLEGRLEYLRANRPLISERIAEARALGDLKENAEYHAAREQQGLEEAEIRRLEERLARAHVVDEDASRPNDVVFLGSTVRLREVNSGDVDVYRLVGEASRDMSAEYIEVTASSPMGEALMKARIGEQIRVKAPRGIKVFEIVEML